jgi:prepilin-type N-terminal cleavage/methylation domain-containing protein
LRLEVFTIIRIGENGFTLVEIVVVVVLLGLIGAFFYSGINAGVGTSQRGKDKVEAVSVLQAVTEELASLDLKPHVGRGNIYYDGDWIPNRYSVRYSVADTEYGVYRLRVEVNQGEKVLASNTTLVGK